MSRVRRSVCFGSLELLGSGILVLLVTLQHDLDPDALTSGLKRLDRLLQREAVGHQGLHVHLPRRHHGYGYRPAATQR